MNTAYRDHCPTGTSCNNLCIQPEGATYSCDQRPQHLRGPREAIRGMTAATFSCGHRPQQFISLKDLKNGHRSHRRRTIVPLLERSSSTSSGLSN